MQLLSSGSIFQRIEWRRAFLYVFGVFHGGVNSGRSRVLLHVSSLLQQAEVSSSASGTSFVVIILIVLIIVVFVILVIVILVVGSSVVWDVVRVEFEA